ncbi:neuromedin-U receptor 2 [Manduca sexta]|uniref:neuromedin-U receptor 2 n=1 Tax=Manduca sexta TaxID=7130 RepID=UPI00188F112C|nr:neuromedin-U receptor 2 [Manduca sexta]
MIIVDDSEKYNNNSYTFFGPLGMAFHDNGIALEDTYTVKCLLSVVLLLVMIVSITGNVCTCAVIARNRSMRSPTNCYLFHLAVTDLLMAFFVPIDIYILWIPEFYPLGEIGCRIHLILFDCLCNCSLLIITTFTVERYMVVKKPFLRQKLSNNSRVCKLVAVMWFISCCFCIPDLVDIDFKESKKYVFCYVTMSYIMTLIITAEIFVFYVIPLTIIIVMYVLITIELKFKKKLRSSPANGQQNRDKAVIMLGAVALSFCVFWAPYCVLRIMLIWPKFTYEEHYNTWKILNYLCYNSYVSSAVNPILYSLMSRKFRQAFKDIFNGRKPRARKRMDSTRNSLLRNNTCRDIIMSDIKLYT